MALTRAQLLSGNSSQGTVLPGQVQAVSQGAGVIIASNGQISVDAATTTGLVKLNNPTAYNAYVWPNVDGAADQFLQTDGAGNLTWSDATGFAVVTVSSAEPTPADEGELWYDCTVGALKIYQTCTAPGGWTAVSEIGLEVDPTNTTASPSFVSGSGTSADPYIAAPVSVGTGGEVIVVNNVSVIGLAPYQYVPIVDLNAATNGGRFRATNYYADAAGVLLFQIIFSDNPSSTLGTAYTMNLRVGSSSVYIDSVVTAVDPISVSPGSISGSPAVGNTLTYTIGSASGGTGGYTYSYVWKNSDGTVLATDTPSYVITSAEIGKSVYVELTVTDSSGASDSADTASVGPVNKPPFPNPTPPDFPTVIDGESSFVWDGGNENLTATGCIEFKVGSGGTYGQGSQSVVPGQTVYTRWLTDSSCGGAANGTTITGTLQSTNYAAVATLTIDRVPSPFAFIPATNVAINTVATSAAVTPLGYNSTAYVTLQSATGTGVQASIGGGSYVTVPSSGTLLPINPGQSLSVRFTVGSSPNATYEAQIAIGDGTSVQTATFSATAAAGIFPNTFVTFPTYIPEVTSFTWADGSTSIETVGCIEFSLDGTAYTSSSTAVADGNTVYLRWKETPACGAQTSGDIAGSLTNGTYINSSTLNIQRVPDAYSFTDLTDAALGSFVESNAIALTGITAPAYLTYAPGTTSLESPEYSNDGGSTWSSIPTSGTSAPVNPDAAFMVRAKTGASVTTLYSLDLKLGVSGTTTDTVWSVTTSTAGIIQPSITSIVGLDGISYSAPTEPVFAHGSSVGYLSPTSPVAGLTVNAYSPALPATGGSGSGLTANFNTDGSGQLVTEMVEDEGSGYVYGETVYFDLTSLGGSSLTPFVVYTQPVTSNAAIYGVSTYTGVNAGAFSQSEWEFDVDPSFSNPATVVSTESSADVPVSVPDAIPPGSPYYLRCRYKSSLGLYSEYSLTVKATLSGLVSLRYIFKSFTSYFGSSYGGSYDSNEFYVAPKPHLYFVGIDNTGLTNVDAAGLNMGGYTAASSSTNAFPGRAAVYLQLRQPVYLEVTSVGASGEILALEQQNVAYGVNDWYAYSGNPGTLTGGTGGGAKAIFVKNSETKATEFYNIYSGGSGYTLGDVLTFTPPLGNGNNRAGAGTITTGFSEGTLDRDWDVMIHGMGGMGGNSGANSPAERRGSPAGYLTGNGGAGQSSGGTGGTGGVAAYSLYIGAGGGGSQSGGGGSQNPGAGGGPGWGGGGGGDNGGPQAPNGGGGGATWINTNFVTAGEVLSASYPQEGIRFFINGAQVADVLATTAGTRIS